MKFGQSGLINHPLVEQAFNTAYTQATQGESLETALGKIRQNMENWYKETLQHYQSLSYDKDEQAASKKRLDREYDGYLAGAEDLAKNILEDNFTLLNLRPAQEILDYAENTPPHVVAAALLLPGVISDEDISRITAELGAETGNLVHALHHLKDDPDLAEYSPQDIEDFKDEPLDPQWELDALAASSDEVKTIYLARMTVILQHEIDGTKDTLRHEPRADVALEAGRQEKLHALAKAACGVNPELDRRFRDAFNELASLTSAPFRIALDRVGELELKPAEEMIPQKVKPKEKPSNEPPSVDVL